MGFEFGLSSFFIEVPMTTLRIDGFVRKQRGMKTFENDIFISFICLIIFIIKSAINS